MKISKVWENKAKAFANYVRDEYNEDRHICATLGSAGYTFISEIDILKEALVSIGEKEIVDLINKGER